MSSQDFTIFDIPDFINTLGPLLDQQTLTSCLRVNKIWYQDFFPHLWRDICVFDFDFNHLEDCCQNGPWGEEDEHGRFWAQVESYDVSNDIPDRQLCCIQGPDEPGEGHHRADRFSHQIRSIQAGSLQALDALGPGCVNLEYVKFDQEPTSFEIQLDSSSKIWLWKHERPKGLQPLASRIWLDLLQRNPRIKYLEMNMGPNEPNETHGRLHRSLGNFGELEGFGGIAFMWGF